jgi:hypothetical protein
VDNKAAKAASKTQTSNPASRIRSPARAADSRVDRAAARKAASRSSFCEDLLLFAQRHQPRFGGAFSFHALNLLYVLPRQQNYSLRDGI